MATRCFSPPESWDREMLRLIAEIHEVQDIAARRLLSRHRTACRLHRERDVLVRGLVRNEAEVLEDHADFAAVVVERREPGSVVHVDGFEKNRARCRPFLREEHLEERGLSRRPMADDGDEFFGGDREVTSSELECVDPYLLRHLVEINHVEGYCTPGTARGTENQALICSLFDAACG